MKLLKALSGTSVFGFIAMLVPALYLTPSQALAQSCYNIVVAQDGSGNYTDVQSAFNAVPNNSANRTVIFIKNGTYQQAPLTLASNKINVTVVGQSLTGTILSYNNYNGKVDPATGVTFGTGNSASFFLNAAGFYATNISFQNSAGPVGQALAINISGDKAVFSNCNFLGRQDTVYGNTCRQYFQNCYIEGTTDFIFGPSTAVFQNCQLHTYGGTALTAASTNSYVTYGYVFLNCNVTAQTTSIKTDLGRPWRPYAAVAYLNCNLGSVINPPGWDDWNNTANDSTARFSEYQDTSTNTVTRVSWSSQLTAAQAALYTPLNVLSATNANPPVTDNWNPFTVMNSLPSTCVPSSTVTPLSATNTATRTFTLTPTHTPTPSSTATKTSTYSLTPTASATVTPTKTNTTVPPTATNTATPTRTNTPMPPTATNTAPPTFTPTATNTETSTRSYTAVPSTATPTTTSSTTNTSTATPSDTGTSTPVNTFTFTVTASMTPTASLTATPTPSQSPTVTTPPTNSPTVTSTFTHSMTSTSIPTHTSTPANTATSPSTATSTNTDTASSTPMMTSTPTYSPTGTTPPANTLTETPTSTHSMTTTTTSTPTATFTSSPTSTPTSSPANTRIFTFTVTPALTDTFTPTFTPAYTGTPFPAATSTPAGNTVVVIYPNPASGKTVNVLPPAYEGISNVRVEVFTVAFRKVADKAFTHIPTGTAVTISLTDRWGSPLASGIYYVVITTSRGRSIGKLLIQR